MAETQAKTQITRVGRVIIPVSDQDAALDFYRDQLGFEVRMDMPYGRGDRWLEVAPPGSTTTVAIVPPMEGNPMGIDTHTAFETEDIDAAHAELRDRGVDVDPEVMRMGDPVPPMFFFRDQDGNRYLLVQPS